MTESDIADFSQRMQALDTGQSCIVQAPAGSGKTELISQRFLKLLAICEHPEAVLAITFTRKAASEMRQRILNALASASLDEPTEAHKKLTWQLARQALRQDRLHNWQLLHNPSRLRVVTIDSFCSSLTRQMPLLSSMGSAATPLEDATPCYLEAARRTLADLEGGNWADDVARLMLHLGNNVERIQQLLTGMLARRDQWLRHLAGSQEERLQRAQLEQAFSNLVQDHLDNLLQLSPAGFIQEAGSIASYAASHVDADKKPNIARWQHGDDFQPDNRPQQLPYWQGLADLLLTDKGDVRKQGDQRIGIPAPSSSKDADAKAFYLENKNRLKSLLLELEQQSQLVQALARLRVMPALQYTEDQWQLVQSLIRVLLLSAAHLNVVFAEKGQVDFAEIAMSASRALGTADEPTDLALILDYRLQHILVDEFQDTSQGQFELLEKLTHGWQTDDGRTLFLVGDPMQSIYRFREAEVGLYLKARRQGIGDIRLKPLFLSVNFRSQQGIVEWVNQSLSQVFPTQEDMTSGAVSYSESIAFHAAGQAPAVNIHAQLERDDVLEAQRVVGIVRQALQQTDNGSIAILVRSRSHLQHIIAQLKSAAIGFQAVDLDALQDKGSVIDLLSLTLALQHSGDRLHWLALLRAPWCGLTLDDLLVIASGKQPSIWQNCQDQAVQQQLSPDGRQRLQVLMTRLSPYLQQAYRMPLRQWIEAIWHTIGGHACYADQPDQLEAIDSYLALLDAHEHGGRIADQTAFQEALAKLFAPADHNSDGRLQIMTMHKAKGLEFDVVILPGLGRAAKSDDIPLLNWLERPSKAAAADLLIAPIKAAGNNRTEAIGESLKAINNDKARHETTRLLYVAATRAKKQLHLLGHAGKNSKGNITPVSRSLLETLWPVITSAYTEEAIAAATHPLDEHSKSQQKLRRLAIDWQPAVKAALAVSQEQCTDMPPAHMPDPEFDWASETARHIGTLTHRYLEYFACNPDVKQDCNSIVQQRANIRSGLENLGVEADKLEQACDHVSQALCNTFENVRGRWILQPHQQACCEYALTRKTAAGFKRYIIDRTFVDEQGVRWIIDYKSGTHQGSDTEAFLDQEQQRYRAQLQQYGELMQQLDDRKIRLALYFPLLQGWREWPFQPDTGQ